MLEASVPAPVLVLGLATAMEATVLEAVLGRQDTTGKKKAWQERSS